MTSQELAGLAGAQHAELARLRREYAALRDERDRLIDRLAAMCDDDWLRRRDRCMRLHGCHNQYARNPASAWEQAAHDVRRLLEEHGYEPSHDAYREWLRNGRDGEDGAS